MANKYCDHGLYGGFVATAGLTNASATMTVTGLTSGRIGIGAEVTGTGIPADTYISALGTGVGGAGSTTYTLSKNATATNTGVTVTGIYGTSALVPEWNVAQEGDGTSSGAATPATVSIDLSAYTADATDTISIGGATLTCVASGASTNQFNAGTGTTLIDNIVTGINRTTNTVTVSAAATGWATPKIQDCFYAQRNGNYLEVMTRAGSATYNSNSGFKVVTSGFTGGSQLDQQFASGAGGAWGLIANINTAAWPSAIAIGTYGVWAATTALAGVVAAGDIINIRSGKTIRSLYVSAARIITHAAVGSALSPVHCKIDESTIWSDGTDPVLCFKMRVSQSGPCAIEWNSGGWWNVEAPSRPTDNYYGLYFDSDGISYSSGVIYFRLINRTVSGLRIKVPNGAAVSAAGMFTQGAVSGQRMLCKNWRLELNSTQQTVFGAAYNNAPNMIEIEDLVIDAGSPSTAHPGLIYTTYTASNEFRVTNCKCINFVLGSKLEYQANSYLRLTFVDFDGGNVNILGPGLNNAALTAGLEASNPFVVVGNTIPGRKYIQDTSRGLIEWNPTRAFPVVNATLPEGTNPKWSFFGRPQLSANMISLQAPLAFPPTIKRNTLADGARTFTFHFCVQEDVTVNRLLVWARVTYTDVSGDRITLNSQDPTAAALTADSGTTWEAITGGTQESGGQVTFDDSGTVYLDKYKIDLSTETGHNVETDTDVICELFVAYQPTLTTHFMFFDPDVAIA